MFRHLTATPVGSSAFTRWASAAAAAAAVLALTPAPVPALASGHHSSRSSQVSWNAASKAATVRLTAAATGAANGFNFNGYANGQLTVTVPTGAKVTVIFKNNSATVPHSALIVPFAQRTSTTLTPAFPGATTANATTGIMKGKTQQFTFTASKKGKYAIVCGVPGHAPAGMWDVLRVKNGAAVSITHK